MRNQLGAFDPSEQKFREIFKIRKKFDDEFQLAGRASDPAGIDRHDDFIEIAVNARPTSGC